MTPNSHLDIDFSENYDANDSNSGTYDEMEGSLKSLMPLVEAYRFRHCP